MQLTSRAGIVNPATGNVSGASLANKLQQSDRSGYLFGGNQSDLYNAARFASAFKPIVGDSGTATRSMNLKDMALAIPGNISSWAYLHPAAPLIRAAANSPQAVKEAIANGASPTALQALGVGAATAEQNQ